MTVPKDLPVKATQTSNRVLEAVIAADGATLADLVDRLEQSRSSIHNHLTTLEQLGYLSKDGQQYRVSLRFFEIGAGARNQFPLYATGRSRARDLSNATGLSASLVAFERDHLTCLYTAPGPSIEEPAIAPGDVLPLHCTAPGKSILASHSPATVVELLSRSDLSGCTENTLTTTEALQAELERIRSQGWAADREEWQIGLRSLATSVLDPDGELLGALCVIGTPNSLSGKRFEQDIPGLLISSATEIQTALGR